MLRGGGGNRHEGFRWRSTLPVSPSPGMRRGGYLPFYLMAGGQFPKGDLLLSA